MIRGGEDRGDNRRVCSCFFKYRSEVFLEVGGSDDYNLWHRILENVLGDVIEAEDALIPVWLVIEVKFGRATYDAVVILSADRGEQEKSLDARRCFQSTLDVVSSTSSKFSRVCSIIDRRWDVKDGV